MVVVEVEVKVEFADMFEFSVGVTLVVVCDAAADVTFPAKCGVMVDDEGVEAVRDVANAVLVARVAIVVEYGEVVDDSFAILGEEGVNDALAAERDVLVGTGFVEADCGEVVDDWLAIPGDEAVDVVLAAV